MARTFETHTATRESVPLLLALVGASTSGKTLSALRLAEGIRRVAGGEIFVIDTEAKRSTHYADRFKFQLLSFTAPFSPLDYLAAIEHCVAKGAKTIVIDSLSYEHEGPGGVLEWHAAELARLGGRQSRTFEAWQAPKAARRKLINTMEQLGCNFVLCFRAKQGLKIVKGEDPRPVGWEAVGGPEFVYQMSARFLLLPGCDGVPTFNPTHPEEERMTKLPDQFRWLMSKPAQLSEDLGEKLARWAAGDVVTANGTTTPPAIGPTAVSLVAEYDACCDDAGMQVLKGKRSIAWKTLSEAGRDAVRSAAERAKARIEAAAKAPEVPMEYEPSDADDSRDDAAHANYVRDPEAWRLHLENEPNPHAVAGAYHKRSVAFDRAGVRDARRESAVTVIAMKSNGDLASADAFLTAYPDRAKRKASGAQSGEGA